MADLSPVQTDKSFGSATTVNSPAADPHTPAPAQPDEPPTPDQIEARVVELYAEIPIGGPISSTTCVSAR